MSAEGGRLTAESDQQALIDALHAERTEAGTTHIDCWACEAAQSKAIADLLVALRRAQSALGATEVVLSRAVPDEAALLALWRDFWRERLADMPRPASSLRPVIDVNPPPDREHFTCHREGDVCAWDGCPNQHDDRACEGCFLIQPDVVTPPAPTTPTATDDGAHGEGL